MLHVIHNYVPSECLLSIYNAFVMPYLTYYIELWGNACTTYLNPIQLLQKKCIRYICNAQCLAHCKPILNQFMLYYLKICILCLLHL